MVIKVEVLGGGGDKNKDANSRHSFKVCHLSKVIEKKKKVLYVLITSLSTHQYNFWKCCKGPFSSTLARL